MFKFALEHAAHAAEFVGRLGRELHRKKERVFAEREEELVLLEECAKLIERHHIEGFVFLEQKPEQLPGSKPQLEADEDGSSTRKCAPRLPGYKPRLEADEDGSRHLECVPRCLARQSSSGTGRRAMYSSISRQSTSSE